MTDLPHRLVRDVVVRARRETVFGFFQTSEKWAAWWGAGSEIDSRPGGRVKIRHANGVEVSGEVLESDPPSRLVFTWGLEQGRPGPGASRVTIVLEPHPDGTRLELVHEFEDAGVRDEYVQGWRYHLSVFVNLIASTANADVAALVDRWCALWSDPDDARRNRALDEIVTADLRLSDRFSCISGLDDARVHLAAVHRFMPGIRLERRGAVRHCQWRALADWEALGADGARRGGGTSVFDIDADGRIASVVGFWSA